MYLATPCVVHTAYLAQHGEGSGDRATRNSVVWTDRIERSVPVTETPQ